MYFLIGVIVLIIFTVSVYLYIRVKLKRFMDDNSFMGTNILDVVREARLEDQEVPKSLSSMDSIYLEQVRRDFPDLNINELKKEVEKNILDCFNAIEKKSSVSLKGKMKSFVDDLINDYGNKTVKFDNFRFHNTVLSNYSNTHGMVTLTFGSSFEYYLNVDGNSVKTQDRARVEYIYVVDIDEVSADKKVLGLNCPNCGASIKHLKTKTCAYCGTGVVDIVSRVFTFNNIVRY